MSKRIVFFTVVFLAVLGSVKLGVYYYAFLKVTSEDLEAPFNSLKDIHHELSFPKPGDWLAHQMEFGQSYEEYVRASPLRPATDRRTIYIQPIGAFTESWKEITDQTGKFMQLFFCLPIKQLQSIPPQAIPSKARRQHPYSGVQFLTTFINHSLLSKNIPDDAIAYVGFSANDLWPGRNWNFVFGEAYTGKRVGVWSTYRLGTPSLSEQHYQKALLRTLKIATHELGHSFGLGHCTGYQCNMNGSNSLEEADSQPLYLCPSCLKKLIWNTGCDPLGRYNKLADFANEIKVAELSRYYSRAAQVFSVAD